MSIFYSAANPNRIFNSTLKLNESMTEGNDFNKLKREIADNYANS